MESSVQCWDASVTTLTGDFTGGVKSPVTSHQENLMVGLCESLTLQFSQCPAVVVVVVVRVSM